MSSPGNQMELDDEASKAILAKVTQLCAAARERKAGAATAAENVKLGKEKQERLAQEKKEAEEVLKRIATESEKTAADIRKAEEDETRLEMEGGKIEIEIGIFAEHCLGTTDPQVIASWVEGRVVPGPSGGDGDDDDDDMTDANQENPANTTVDTQAKGNGGAKPRCGFSDSDSDSEAEVKMEVDEEAEPEKTGSRETPVVRVEPKVEPRVAGGSGAQGGGLADDGESGSDGEALEIVASLQTKSTAYDLVGEVMQPRGYVSIQHESHGEIQSALEDLKSENGSRDISASAQQEIHRWTCRLGTYAHYMTPFWLSSRLSNLWEMSTAAGGRDAVSYEAVIPKDHHEAIAHIAKEFQRVPARKAWEQITFADLCFRAWHLFQDRWQEIYAEDEARPGPRRPGRPENMAKSRAKDEFLTSDFFNRDAENAKPKKELQAERTRITELLYYGRDLADFVEAMLGESGHADAQSLFLIVPFEQVVRLARSSSMALVPSYVRQWVFGRMMDDKYLVIDGTGSTAKKMKSFTATLAGLAAPYIVRGELLVRLHADPPARRLGLAPVDQLRSDLNALAEEYLGLAELFGLVELSTWPDVVSDLSKDPLDVFAKVAELAGGFPDIVWENDLSGEKRVIVASEDLLRRVEDPEMDLDAVDIVSVIMASEPRTEWMIVTAMEIEEGSAPLGDQVHKWLVVAKAPKIGSLKRHLLCMAVIFSGDFKRATVCIVDPFLKGSEEIRSYCEGIVSAWVDAATQVEYLNNLPYDTLKYRSPCHAVARVIAHGIAITQAGKVWPGLLEKEKEVEFSAAWRRYAKQTIMCPPLVRLRLDDGVKAGSDDDKGAVTNSDGGVKDEDEGVKDEDEGDEIV